MGEGLIVRRGGSGKAEGKYVWKKYDSEGGNFIDYVTADDESSYPNGGTKSGYWYDLYGVPVKTVSWATGTDAEIVAMIEAADKGAISLADYWAVGDERKVKLSAMSATGVAESHAAQEVTLVLMNLGGKTLANGKECNFIVGQKHSLATAGYVNSTAVNTGGWASMARRTWCNNVYYNAIPATLRPIFKQHLNVTFDASSKAVTTTDYFALPAEMEVFGATVGAHPSFEGNLTPFAYYATASHRVKKQGEGGAAATWWGRSPYQSGTSRGCYTNPDGTASSGYVNSALGIAPFGCI